MKTKLLIYINRLREKLWFRPFVFCLISIGGALIAHQADGMGFNELIPNIEKKSIHRLLDTISASMLVISIFAVASMLSAFASASSTATPRSFNVVITDDVSQNALSVFIGAFIFSIVATIALDNGYYGKSGRFTLFLFTIILFAVVIFTFIKWVDRISRLGRLEHTIDQIETIAAKSLKNYIKNPNLKAFPSTGDFAEGKAVYNNNTGYVQYINLEVLQELATENDLKIRLYCLPGKFINPNFVVAQFRSGQKVEDDKILEKINKAFVVGDTRRFDEDPRFGFISLSEIASRALSPGINDPGTAIQIIGSQERLFFLWNEKIEKPEEIEVVFDRLEVPKIAMQDFFDDAFRPICRDGAGNIEVMLRLQKTFAAMATIKNPELKALVFDYSKTAFSRAEAAQMHPQDLELLEKNSFYKHSF